MRIALLIFTGVDAQITWDLVFWLVMLGCRHEQSCEAPLQDQQLAKALKQRGLLTVWLDADVAWEAKPSAKLGRPQSCSAAAIQACLALRVLFGLPLRQATGFMESLLTLSGRPWSVPDFSTLRRRQNRLQVAIPYRSNEGLHLRIDSTGIKVEGEGDWQRRKHGGSERPSPRFLKPVAKPWFDWRKIQIAVDAQTLESRAIEVTSNAICDALVPDLRNKIAPRDHLCDGGRCLRHARL